MIKTDLSLVSNFTKKDNLIAFINLFSRVVIHFFLIYFSYYFYSNENYYLLFITFYLNSVLWHFFGYAGISHELFHLTVFTNRKVNKFFFIFFSYITFNNPFFFQKQHAFHHSSTFNINDNEVVSHKFYSKIDLFYKIFIDFPVLYRRVLYLFLNSFSFGVKFKNFFKFEIYVLNNEYSPAVNHARKILICILTVTIMIFLFTESFFLILMFLITPFTGSFLNFILSLSQHIGLSSGKEKGAFYHSRSIVLPKLLCFFYANMNYHIEHHYAPQVPFYNLPKFSHELKKKYKYNVENHGFSFLFSNNFVKLFYNK